MLHRHSFLTEHRLKRKAWLSGMLSAVLLFFSLFICCAFPAVSTAGEPLLIRVGAYDNPPKITIDDNGKISGFWPDLISHIARRENWRIEYVSGDWSEGLENLANKKIDIMPDVAFTEERAELYAFNNVPVLMSWSRLYAAKNNKEIQSIRDLQNKKIAGLRDSVNIKGTGGLREIINSFDLNCTIIEFDSYQKVFSAVETGTADGGITNRNFGDSYAKNYKVKKTPIIFQPINIQFALPKSARFSTELIQKLDRNMEELKKDDSSIYYRLLSTYFESGITEKEVEILPSWLKLVLFAGSGATLFFILVAVASRIQVSRKTKELRITNEELQKSSQRYREIFNSPNDAIFIHDATTGAIVDVNRAMLEMYGYERKEALLLQPEDCSSNEHPHTREEAIKLIGKAMTEGTQRFDWRAKKKDGSLFWVDVDLKHAKIGRQEFVIAVVRDIDQRKQDEDALTAEKERLAVTLACIGDGVIVTDTKGAVVMLNKVGEQMTGWRQEEAAGLPLPEIFTIYNETTGKPCKNPVDKVLATGAIVSLANHSILVARDGTRRSIADSGAPIYDRKNRIIGAVLVFRDVTEKEKTEKELVKIKKLEAVGVLAGGIAHDFNNILTAILGNINLASTTIGPENEAYPLLQEAEKASIRARDLTQQLLTFSRGGDPVRKTTSLDKIIIDSANFILHGSPVACRFNIPEDLWLVEADAGQISQVIQNIVLNGRHAMPEGGEIRISCANLPDSEPETLNLPEKKYIKITIADSGGGIPEKHLDRIFDPYFSTKQEGSGLGLAICHSIINKHGGRIVVNSEMDKGTTFTIYLPAKDQQSGREKKKTADSRKKKQATILVMDDEKIVQDVAKQMLEHLGHHVLLAEDGERAVEIYSRQRTAGKPVDLVIMDLTIPGGMGGRVAVEKILEIDPEAKVLVASGYSNDPVMADFRKFGFKGAVVKPFSLPELNDALDRLLP